MSNDLLVGGSGVRQAGRGVALARATSLARAARARAAAHHLQVELALGAHAVRVPSAVIPPKI